jgi:hypothetical protein
MRNAEKYENQSFSLSHFRIPHSEFLYLGHSLQTLV